MATTGDRGHEAQSVGLADRTAEQVRRTRKSKGSGFDERGKLW